MILRGIDFGEPGRLLLVADKGGLLDACQVEHPIIYSFSGRDIASFAALVAAVPECDHEAGVGISVDCTNIPEWCDLQMRAECLLRICTTTALIRNVPLLLEVTYKQLTMLVACNTLALHGNLDAVCVTSDSGENSADLAHSLIELLLTSRRLDIDIGKPIVAAVSSSLMQAELLEVGVGSVETGA